MMLLSTLTWWYTAGWAGLAHRASRRVSQVLEMFSVQTLLETLFDPFRQISAGRVQGGPLEVRLRALGDRVFSRVFGAAVRTVIICIGLIAALLAGLASLVQLLIWPFIPCLPVVGVVVALIGWTP